MSTENKKVVKENKALKNENENLIEQVQSVTAENGLLMDKVTHLENQNKSYEMLVKGLTKKAVHNRRFLETEERNTNSSKISGEECIFCFSNRPDHAFIRCGHVCLCNGCVNTFQKKEKKCPICRKDFDFIQKIFF
jgi:rubrerythrin